MAKVSLKSTKQEILDALHEAEKQLKEQKSIMSTPGAEAEKVKQEAVIEEAAVDVKAGIFSDEMNEKYQNLSEAIKLLEDKLKSLYDVDAELSDMVVVINAKKQAQLTLDAELEKRKAEIAAELEQAKKDASATAATLKTENERLKADLAVARKREQEQYDYDLKRTRKLDADQYADETAALDKQLAEAKERLAALKEDADAIVELQEKVKAMPDELEAKYQEGIEAGQKAAGKEYGYKTTMTAKEHEYQIRERDSRIERLEQEVEEKTAKISSLETKLDAAYTQLRDLATKTVESNGGVKVISAGGSDSSARK